MLIACLVSQRLLTWVRTSKRRIQHYHEISSTRPWSYTRHTSAVTLPTTKSASIASISSSSFFLHVPPSAIATRSARSSQTCHHRPCTCITMRCHDTVHIMFTHALKPCGARVRARAKNYLDLWKRKFWHKRHAICLLWSRLTQFMTKLICWPASKPIGQLALWLRARTMPHSASLYVL